MRFIFFLVAFFVCQVIIGQTRVNKQVLDTLSNYQSAVCLIIYDGDYTCTGTLINNTSQDGRALILSAAHCIDDPSQIESIVIVMGRQRVIQGSNISGFEWRSSFGAELLSFSYELDFALLELNQEIPDEVMCQFLGWDVQAPYPNTTSVIHHPSFEFKEFTHSRNVTQVGTFRGLDNTIENGHWEVDGWTFGETVTGSSGSALIDDRLMVIGGLSGSTRRGDAISNYFFRFNKAWNFSDENQLKSHLDSEQLSLTSVQNISFKKLRNISKISSYTYTDSLSASFYMDRSTSATQVFTKLVSGNLSGIYLTIGEIGSDLLNTLTIRIISNGNLIHAEEVSLFKLDEYEENYISFLEDVPIQSSVVMEISLNSTLDAEFVELPIAMSENGSNMLHSLLVKSVEIEILEDKLDTEPIVFPNPATQFVIIDRPVSKIRILDSKGMLVQVSSEQNAFGQTIIDLESFSKGIYYLELIYHEKISIRKIFVE